MNKNTYIIPNYVTDKNSCKDFKKLKIMEKNSGLPLQ